MDKCLPDDIVVLVSFLSNRFVLPPNRTSSPKVMQLELVRSLHIYATTILDLSFYTNHEWAISNPHKLYDPNDLSDLEQFLSNII